MRAWWVAAGVALAVAATAVLLVTRDDGGPWPGPEHLRAEGFAAWPEDTVDEARSACEDSPEPWRLDPEAMILRFASEMQGYPKPVLYNDRFEDDRGFAQVSTNGPRDKGVFLGSAFDVQRFGNCWYVVLGQPREGAEGPDLAFTYEGGTPRLVVEPDFDRAATIDVGWGSWSRTLTVGAGERVTVPVDPGAEGATGHYIATYPGDGGLSEGVDAVPLPPIPAAGAGERVTGAGLTDRSDDSTLCRLGLASRNSANGLVAHVVRELAAGLEGRKRLGARSTGVRDHGLSRTLDVAGADLRLELARVGDRCWVVRSLTTEPRPVLDGVRVGESAVTLDLRWGDAERARLYYASRRAALTASFRRVGGPITLFRPGEIDDEDLPAMILVALYRGDRLVGAEAHVYSGAS